ncbi:hypothetical protein E4P29_22175 [Rhodococcus sp. 1R11]|uniref:hypothetical protein n=1 Tax=Rhodococcus sp. 1R11 TaxID=2559614 RepID=UPI001072AB76|nr:hypothetical protein [Rhodococcus sp. 1R11]TFI40901.1 hypothetical protein E4P29_22175 [Rhodococcus sp. 1R11]
MRDHNEPEPTQAAVTPTQATPPTQTFLHVDRDGTLARTGGIIDLNGGLSEHGRRYHALLGTQPLFGSVSWAGQSSNVVSFELSIENFFELYRHTMHPALPSRFHSLFAFSSISDAQGFATRAGQAPIWELSVPTGTVIHRGDMDWLKVGTYDVMLDCADKYWTGQPMTATPAWEVLLALPLTTTLTALP